jgi:hypothetical protein
LKIIALAAKIIPLKSTVVPRVTPVTPPTCQKMFLACAA